MAERLIANRRELASTFGVSEPTVDRWVTDGCPVVAGGGKGVPYQFDVQAVLAWRRETEEAAQAAASQRLADLRQQELELTGGSVADAAMLLLSPKDRSLALDAERRAILLAKEKGQLLSRVAVARDYQAVFGVIRQRLLALPTTLARTAGLDFRASKILETEMRGLLRELAAQISDPELRPPDPASGDAPDPPAILTRGEKS